MSDTPRTDKWLAICEQEHSMVVCARAFERELASAIAALRAISDSRADKQIMAQNPNVAMFELAGRMRGIAADALRGNP